jgi:glycosyltransferase involved in cell wall biosynthesis
MARLKDLDPKPLYIVAGKTHPKVLTKSGDQYRKFLEQLVVDCGVEEMVVFDNSYHDLAALGLLIESVDVVVLPYDSKDQATSGVLVDAIAAGRPVIATAFPHAVELLRSGAGIVVAQRDVVGLSQALRRVFTEPHCATSMATEARRLAPGLGWDAVGEQFQTLATQVLSSVEVDA